jgi:putative acetyltransferase
MTPSIRDFRDDDAEAAARLFYETVRTSSGPAYDERQRAAWAPRIPDTGRWRERLGSATTLVAEDAAGISGFMSLDDCGHLDLAYVRNDLIGTGVAKALYDALLARAQEAGFSRLTTDASVTARSFFERQGWVVLREQRPNRHGVQLTNYRMEIRL